MDYKIPSTTISNQSWNWQLGPKFGQKHLPPISNSPQIDLFLIKGKDIKYMLERSVSGLCSNGSCYSNVLQLSGIRVTYRVTDTNKYNRIKECCTNTFWPLQNLRKIPVFRIFNSLAKNQHTQETWELSTYVDYFLPKIFEKGPTTQKIP